MFARQLKSQRPLSLFKNDGQSLCANFRGISHLSNAYKASPSVMFKRLERGMAIVDQMFTLHQIEEKIHETRIANAETKNILPANI